MLLLKVQVSAISSTCVHIDISRFVTQMSSSLAVSINILFSILGKGGGFPGSSGEASLLLLSSLGSSPGVSINSFVDIFSSHVYLGHPTVDLNVNELHQDGAVAFLCRANAMTNTMCHIRYILYLVRQLRGHFRSVRPHWFIPGSLTVYIENECDFLSLELCDDPDMNNHTGPIGYIE